MAVDTLKKRASLRRIVFPDGEIDQADRQTLAGVYGGILAQTVVAEVVGLAQIAFAGKVPSVSFADISPAVVFTGKVPSISFTGVS